MVGGYCRYKRDNSRDDWKTIHVTASGETAMSMSVYNLRSNTAYKFMVLSRNRLGDGLFSAAVTATTKGQHRVVTSCSLYFTSWALHWDVVWLSLWQLLPSYTSATFVNGNVILCNINATFDHPTSCTVLPYYPVKTPRCEILVAENR